MDFTHLDIKPEYRTNYSDIVEDFLNPILKKSIKYQRAVGYFTSSSLSEMANGIEGLILNGGKIEIVASPNLTHEDIEAIANGYNLRDRVKNVMESSLEDYVENNKLLKLNLLANLIADNRLDIKIVLLKNSNRYGLYHEKMGLFYDGCNNIIAFSGSLNETENAFRNNIESIDVFKSWEKDIDRVNRKLNAFNDIWNNHQPNIVTLDFNDIGKDLLDKYKKHNTDYILEELKSSKNHQYFVKEKIGPCIPYKITLRPYQKNAISKWMFNDSVGIFDMATGTGKTITGLGAVVSLYERLKGKLAVIIVCPFMHLVEQWVEDIENFNMKPIIAYSQSNQKNWEKFFNSSVNSFNIGVREHFCLITTNVTFISDKIQNIMGKLRGNVLIVIDEAHYFGASHLRKYLPSNIKYRLALSATIERHMDEEGTKSLFDYFGEKCIEYSLKKAIENKMLTPYYYYPILTFLDENEKDIYIEYTDKINKYLYKDEFGKTELRETGKKLLIERAKIIAATSDKITKLENIIKEDYKSKSHILVYCGAASIVDPRYSEGKLKSYEIRQIDLVTRLLAKKLGLRVSQFTSAENNKKRKKLLSAFSNGRQIQALIAIRCLDEGVNVPSIKTAFILASSTNPKEYIQRRGRVLRKEKNKKYAEIYDFITLPYKLEEVKKYSTKEISKFKSLLQKEINRMHYFTETAILDLNNFKLIEAITDKYKINVIGGVDDEY